ncbi:hypothetical protein D3C75_1006300 [compost metagenome]
MLEADIHHMTKPENQQGYNSGAQRRKRYMPDLPPPASPVHNRSLVERRVYRSQRRKKNDGPPAGFLPHVLEHINITKISGVRKQLNPPQAQIGQQLVDCPLLGGEQGNGHAHYHDP